MSTPQFSTSDGFRGTVAYLRPEFAQVEAELSVTITTEPLVEELVLPNIESMSTPTREEFEARLETIEAKMDSRVASIEGKIDTLLATLEGNEKVYVERVKTYDARFVGFEERDKRLEMLARQANDSATVAADAAKQAAGLRASYWASVAAQIAAVAAIIVGAYFANQSSIIGISQIVAGQQSQPPNPAKK